MARAWYAVHTISGHENKVREHLTRRAELLRLEEDIFEIMIPTEQEAMTRNGKRVVVAKKVFPGYVLIQMNMTEDTERLVRGTPGVTSFVPKGGRPVPLEESEVRRIVHNLTASQEVPKVAFNKSDVVRVIDGPFIDYTGKVEEVNAEHEKLRVLISIFGRDTPVELDFSMVEKM
jgi:transcription termination/antitermination protein NusG